MGAQLPGPLQSPGGSESLVKATEEVGVLSLRRGDRCWLSTRPQVRKHGFMMLREPQVAAAQPHGGPGSPCLPLNPTGFYFCLKLAQGWASNAHSPEKFHTPEASPVRKLRAGETGRTQAGPPEAPLSGSTVLFYLG